MGNTVASVSTTQPVNFQLKDCVSRQISLLPPLSGRAGRDGKRQQPVNLGEGVGQEALPPLDQLSSLARGDKGPRL
jgi:hypothetical protein